ncbi:D-inositol-3-phosphate glycosyltransferase [compost metagenome]
MLEWTRSIKRVLSEDALRAALIDEGRKRVREFSWQRTADATLDVYHAVVGARG